MTTKTPPANRKGPKPKKTASPLVPSAPLCPVPSTATAGSDAPAGAPTAATSTSLEAKTKSKKAKAKYHHGDLRLALLAAARKSLEEKGPAGLSFREVARNAGVSHAAPYHHFADKQQLLAALALEAFQGLNRMMDEAVQALDDDATAVQRLVALGRGYVRYACDEPASFKLMWQHDEVDLVKSVDLQLESSAAYHALSVRVEEVHAVFGSAPTPPGLDNIMVWSMVHGIASLFLTNALGIPEEIFDNVVHAMLERGMGALLVTSDDRLPADAPPTNWPYDPTEK